jgi:chloramphenicol 3-O phosphotransferase
MAYIIFLNGTSSSGKSTLAREIQSQSDIPFWHLASDQFVEAGMLPKIVNDGGEFDWSINRPKFFDAFHSCIKSILLAGNNIILDHIIESQEWFRELQQDLNTFDMFFVGVHCPLNVIQKREELRTDRHIGNRYLGEAEYHLAHVHTYSAYDFEIDTSEQSVEQTALNVIKAWSGRGPSRFFE